MPFRGIERFHSTYEELKLFPKNHSCACNARFHSTYEELKPSLAAVSVIPTPGFHSTYEELKPAMLFFWQSLQQVFILPMRN